jgi:hypothetical protein
MYKNSKITIMVALIIIKFFPMAQEPFLGEGLPFIAATPSHSVGYTTLSKTPLNK